MQCFGTTSSASRPQLDIDLANSLAAIPGPAKTNGIAAGVAAAAALIALRANDGSSPLTYYLPTLPLAAGEWDITPAPPCPTLNGVPLGGILFNWGDVKPFGIAASPPPAIGTSRSGPCRLRRSRATSTRRITTR